MAGPTQRAARRSDALSKERVVAATVEILDGAGEGALTVRALTTHLATGRGAIYHHVTGKDELLVAAADAVIGRAVSAVSAVSAAAAADEPAPALRVLALRIFDAIDAHPWVGPQLVREPRQPAVLKIWKSVGLQLQRLGVAEPARSDAGSALVSYVLGSAAQHTAGARRLAGAADRERYLDELATAWTRHDPDPLVREAASQLREHDDRAQFLAGVDIFLAGVTVRR